MTATAVSQMTASISEVAGHVQHTAEEATTANALADDGDRVAASSREAAAEEQAHVAEDIARQVTRIAVTTDSNVSKADLTMQRGCDLECAAHGLRALVERFNR